MAISQFVFLESEGLCLWASGQKKKASDHLFASFSLTPSSFRFYTFAWFLPESSLFYSNPRARESFLQRCFSTRLMGQIGWLIPPSRDHNKLLRVGSRTDRVPLEWMRISSLHFLTFSIFVRCFLHGDTREGFRNSFPFLSLAFFLFSGTPGFRNLGGVNGESIALLGEKSCTYGECL